MRNATVDYARLIASIGIVIFHSGAPGASIGYAGLPFFLVLLALFGLSQNSAETSSLSQYTRERASRLLLPWLGWSAIYGSAKIAEAIISGRSLNSEFALWMIATGPALHLWFLPFAFLAGFVLWPLSLLHAQNSNGVVHVICFLVASFLALISPILLPYDYFQQPLAQYLFAVPSFLLGVALAFAPRPALALLMMAIITAFLLFQGLPGGALQLLIAGWAVLFCVHFPLPASSSSRLAARLSLTIYLMHPLVLALSARVLHLPTKGLEIGAIGLLLTIGTSALLHYSLSCARRQSLFCRFLGL